MTTEFEEETSQEGFMLVYRNGNLTIVDSMGGGSNLGFVTDYDEAAWKVADYIEKNADLLAEYLVEQIEFPDEEEE